MRTALNTSQPEIVQTCETVVKKGSKSILAAKHRPNAYQTVSRASRRFALARVAAEKVLAFTGGILILHHFAEFMGS
jgi:hypothetical protein